MTKRELSFIRSAMRGLCLAREHLSCPNSESLLAEAIEQLFEEHPGPLTNEEIAYFAAMLLEWQSRGAPDLLT